MHFVFFYENLTKISQHARVEIGIFLIPIALWSRFGIFKQNRNNPNEIKIVGQSEFIQFWPNMLKVIPRADTLRKERIYTSTEFSNWK